MSSVSFVIPVYNKSSYLDHVVKSLKNQIGDFQKEYIFIDDGSTDQSYTKLSKLTKNLKNCKILSVDIKEKEKIDGIDFLCCDFQKKESKEKI